MEKAKISDYMLNFIWLGTGFFVHFKKTAFLELAEMKH